MVEFYAGRGNLHRCMQLSGLCSACLDLKYKGSRKKRTYSSNVMDMTSDSGFWLVGSTFGLGNSWVWVIGAQWMVANLFGSSRLLS